MARYLYQLRIASGDPFEIARVVNMPSQGDDDVCWVIEVAEADDDPPYDYVNEFIGIVEGRYEELQAIGVSRADVSVWVLYEYEQQCNIELRPADMEKLGKNGVTWCLSCWEQDQ